MGSTEKLSGKAQLKHNLDVSFNATKLARRCHRLKLVLGYYVRFKSASM